ncbi:MULTISPECIES: DUF2388 domain-containing protein [unclassified Pseudomonas]|uniref:DUF2388 domain-containing protein n=1 Tax=unclassified Pseudomonas TaxID=196821 RepID=UPI000BCA04B7|nr:MULTISPECIES: DUF2388 domain-containing protein [unclassified Pseudomonas]PVZ08737.1 uncharacterized protein (TIGR02448 family) [Pseudomonas sp. URIL14HWK12:I12]PVZ21136.1 uncharacterized protein (TIGR02448 family) [Pseudomonas sp. URIL14HWK12:I10]PVZ29701.1 uncharacterized protein (TIGR02448 family) [Pseudomonas sp. URIL14HWK12:I11]SNZ18892.1 conserverd hypothetical protein [Pseudomonas sp. URIL14HWK12:I9]
MRKLLSLCLLLAWASSAQAFDTTTQGVVISGYVTSKLTSTPFEHKLVSAAKDDAAVFIASGGEVRGARLEAALDHLREHQPKLHAGDLELAQAILVQ